MNDLDNVAVIEMAAWDEQAWLCLDDPNGQTEGGSTRTVPPEVGGWTADNGAPLVRAGRLDDEFPDLNRRDLVKIDAAGAVFHANEAMGGLHGGCRPTLLMGGHSIDALRT